MLPPKSQQAFNQFYDTVRNREILDEKTTALLGLAAAMATGCAP